MPYRSWWPALIVLWIVLLAAGPAAGQDAPRKNFGGEATVTVVEIPVQVLRGGEPVRGLTAEDFRIFDEGEPREILFFEVVDRGGRAGEGSARPGVAPPAGARRHFLLFFDFEFTDPPSLVRAATAARDLMESGLHPDDLVSVVFYSGRTGLSRPLGFTPDHAQAKRLLDELLGFLEGKGRRERDAARPALAATADPLRLTVGDWTAVRQDIGAATDRELSLAEEVVGSPSGGGAGSPTLASETGGSSGGGRGGGMGAAGQAEILGDMAEIGAADMLQVRASHASGLIAALGVLAEQMRYVEGDKHLLLFSRGYESYLLTGQGHSWLLSELQRMAETFRRSGWRILGIETTRELGSARREALFLMADETGGSLIENRYDLAEALAAVLDRTAVTYLLAFQTPALPPDGSFRRLRVELAERVRGTEVRHRAGYEVPRPYAELDSAARAATAAQWVLSGRESDEIGAHLLATPVAFGADGARVSLLFDLDGPGLVAARTGEPTRIEVLAYAFGRDREVTGAIARTVTVTPEQAARVRRRGGLVLYGEMALAPGEHEVRAVVRNLEDGRVAVQTVTVDVPATAAGESSLLLPVFAGGGSAGRILARIEEGEGAMPFAFGGRPFLPWVAPVLAPDEPAVVVFPGRGMAALTGALRVRILDPSGATVKGGGFALVENVAGAAGALGQVVLSFRPEGLPPGEYALQAFAVLADGSRVVSPPAPFRVRAPGAS